MLQKLRSFLDLYPSNNKLIMIKCGDKIICIKTKLELLSEHTLLDRKVSEIDVDPNHYYLVLTLKEEE